jgi:hypothetical protein
MAAQRIYVLRMMGKIRNCTSEAFLDICLILAFYETKKCKHDFQNRKIGRFN